MTEPILIVDDDPLQRRMLMSILRRTLDFDAMEANHGREALDHLNADSNGTIKLIILDIQMPIMDGLEALEIISAKYPAIPVIMLTGSNDMNDAVRAMKLGAVDFLTKPYEAERIAVTIKNALKISTLTKEVTRLKHQTEDSFQFSDMIGYDKGLAPTVSIGRKAAGADIPVLLTGETGTGKEVFARAIHGESMRATKPFIAVNCGAIPAQLVESTLFGHEKGAFTGATSEARGKFREADGGTLFLDEVGELPLETQVKLLRALQQKEVEPVGAGKSVPVNVRIISATNRDLEHDIQHGLFREDLYFRLNVLPIHLPSLKDRKHDIPALAHHFIDRFCAAEGTVPKTISDSVLNQCLTYHWPGNVRQLENTINRAMVMTDGNVIDTINMPSGEYDSNAHTSPYQVADMLHIALTNEHGEFKSVTEIVKETMIKTLDHFNNNVTHTAKALGIAKSTFYKKMKE